MLFGEAGADWMTGDRGNDAMTGGAGADIFYTWSDAGNDRVTDFSYAEGDRVQLDAGTAYTVLDTGHDVFVLLSGGASLTLANVAFSSLGAGWIFSV